MQKYTAIEGIQHVANSVKILHEIDQRYSKPVYYFGTVKLHGVNAGVRVSPKGQITVQSRTMILTPEKDFKEIAKFVESRKAVFIEIAKSFGSKETITIYGEWIGPGVAKKNVIGVNQLPEKQFVIFGASVDSVGEDEPSYFHEEMIVANPDYSEHRIHFIGEVPSYTLTVDFLDETSLQAAVDKIGELTAHVEAKCPWAAKFGIDGQGEGIVWKTVGDFAGDPVLFFKSKGDKHSVVKVREKPTIAPEVVTSIEGFVEYAVTDNRLEQGLEALPEMGHPIERKSTGHFIKWVIADVQKECSLELAHSNLEWGQVSKAVTTRAREFWLTRLSTS